MQDDPIKQDFTNKPNKKKIIIIVLLAIIICAVITTVTIFLLKQNNTDNTNNTDNPDVVEVLSEADILKQNAVEAYQNDDEEMAKKLFEEAKSEYEKLGDQHGVIDMEAQLHALNN